MASGGQKRRRVTGWVLTYTGTLALVGSVHAYYHGDPWVIPYLILLAAAVYWIRLDPLN